MATVTLNPDRQTSKDVDIALRKLRRAVEDDGTLKDVQAKREYTKPSVVRKLKAAAAKSRWRRQQSNNKLPEKQF